MAKFVYRGKGRTAESIDRKKSEGTRDYDTIFKPGIPVYKPKEGDNCVRILPGTWGESDWDYVIYSHYNVGPDNGRYLCLDKMEKGSCPICDAMLESVDEDEKDGLKPVKGAVCWVIDRDNQKTGPQLWAIPFTKVRNEIHSRSVDRKTRAAILIDDPEEGYDIQFHRKGTDERTTYSAVELDREPSPLSESEKTQQKWLDYIAENPIPDCLNFYEEDYISKVLFGKKTKRKADVDDEDEDEAPRSRRSRAPADDDEDETPSRRRASRRAAEDDDDDEEDAPKSTRIARRPLKDDDEEDEEVPFEGSRKVRGAAKSADDDEDEEEEETPRKGRREPKEDEEDEEEEETPSASARRALTGLKRTGRGR